MTIFFLFFQMFLSSGARSTEPPPVSFPSSEALQLEAERRRLQEQLAKERDQSQASQPDATSIGGGGVNPQACKGGGRTASCFTLPFVDTGIPLISRI